MSRKKTDVEEITPTSDKVERPSRKKKAGGETYGETYVHDEEVRIERRGGKREGAGNPALLGFGKNFKMGDNTRIASVSLRLFQLPDIDLNDPNQVLQRLAEYFQIYAEEDVKPGVAGMAMALNGKDRQWLWAVAHDAPINGQGYKANISRESSDVIKKAYKMLESQWENLASAGKLNPVWAIFQGKNLYNYRDQSDLVVAPRTEETSTLSLEDIQKRYSDSEDVIDSD